MTSSFFLVDAFSSRKFGGNPAAVCLLKDTKEELELHRFAKEINAPVSAFLEAKEADFRTSKEFRLRWLTASIELPLCGHGTLAVGHVLFNEIGNINDKLRFETKSGVLVVSRGENGSIAMDFPQWEAIFLDYPGTKNILNEKDSEECPSFLHDLIGCIIPKEMRIEAIFHAFKAKRLVILLDSKSKISDFIGFRPHFRQMVDFHPKGDLISGVIVTMTAPEDAKSVDSSGNPLDYLCRFFAPWEGNDEDPACGSAQCLLGPLWSKVKGKEDLRAQMPFPERGAEFHVNLPSSGRILICGQAVTVIEGHLRM